MNERKCGEKKRQGLADNRLIRDRHRERNTKKEHLVMVTGEVEKVTVLMS